MDTRDGRDGVDDAFLALPAAVYADDPEWIPEERDLVAGAFAGTNPFFARGRARTWCEPGSVRIAGFFAPDVRIDSKVPAYFGYWETTGDLAANETVFAEVRRWAADQGADVLYGPIDFTTFGRYRVVTATPTPVPPFDKEPYTPPSYPRLLTELGFREAGRRYLSKHFTREEQRSLAEATAPAYDRLLDLGYHVEPLTPEMWTSRLRQLHGLVDQVFGEQFAYTRPSYEEFRRLCGERFAARACPELSAMLFAPDGTVAGFMLNWADFGPLVRQGAGRDRVPAHLLDHAVHFPLLLDRAGTGRTWLGRMGGVHPEHRGHGFVYAMCHVAFAAAVRDDVWDGSVWGIGTEGNGVHHAVRHLGRVTRYYRLFASPLPRGTSRTAP